MFGIGYQEMFVVLVVALIIFGPGRLPELAGQAGRMVRDFRRMTADLTGEFEKTVAEVDDVKRSMTREFQGMSDEVQGVSKSVKKDLGKIDGRNAKKPTAGKKPAVGKSAAAKSGTKPTRSIATNGDGTVQPVATKADPLADVSMLDDDAEYPTNGVLLDAPPAKAAAESRNGSAASAPGETDDALARARRRRATAGYGRVS